MSASLPPNRPEDLDAATQAGLRELRHATRATEADIARLKQRIAAEPVPSMPSRGPVLAGALALVIAGVGGAGLWSFLDGGELDAASVQVADGVLTVRGEAIARLDGRGEAGVEEGRVRLDWVVGTVHADEAAVDYLVIVTPEAVWPVGAAGNLSRDRLGTHLPGMEQARCEGDAEETEAGITCLPVSAPGWLGRAHALVASGEVVPAIDAFSQAKELAEAGSAVRAEAWAGMADALVRGGDVDRGAMVAEDALADGAGTREMQLHTLAARAYLMVGDCGSALPHLRVLPEPSAEEAQHAARCEALLRSPPE